MFKRFMRSVAVQKSIGGLIAAYMTVVKYTTRWDIEGAEKVQYITEGGNGVIALVWHSRFMMLTSAWKKQYQLPYVLISRSRDGNIVAHASHYLGLKTIRGSTKKAAKANSSAKAKGGAKASLDIVTAIENRGCIVITPDGPRGPRQRLGDGPLRLSRATGAPIMPCTFAVARRKQFDSWDRFILPKLFGKGLILWGSPMTVPPETADEDLDAIRLSIETEMNDLLAEADMELGHDAVEPA